MIRRRRAFALVGALALTSVAARAERLPIRTYTTADGLPHDSINRVVQDSRGYVWACTDEGLARFDGYRFTNYSVADGLPGSVVMDLLERRDGSYWVATMRGLARLSASAPARYELLPIDSGSTASEVRILHEDRQGVLWIGTVEGLYRAAPEDGRWAPQLVRFPYPRNSPVDHQVNSIVEEPDGTLWIATRGIGLLRRRTDGTMSALTAADGLDSDNVRMLLLDARGRLWAGSGAGLCRIDPAAPSPVVERCFTTDDGLPHLSVRALLLTRSGLLHVATDSGLATSATSAGEVAAFRAYTTSHGLPHPFLSSLLEDRDGNVWIGTGQGLVKLVHGGFTTYGPEDGFEPRNALEAILEDRRGALCVVSKDPQSDRSLRWFAGGRFEQVHFRLPVAPGGWGSGQTVLQDSRGDWLVPTGRGIYVFPDPGALDRLSRVDPSARLTERDGLITNETFRLFEDSRGEIWVSPLQRWDRRTGAIERFAEAESHGVGFPTAFAEDRAGAIWAGGYSGNLLRYRHGRCEFWTKAQGLPVGSITGLHVDREGRLWIASDQGGAARVDEPASDVIRFVPYTLDSGLSSNEVNCIAEDVRGRIYLGTGRGVDRIDPATGRIRRYTSADGLAGSRIRLALRARDGALWFATTNALSRLEPVEEQERPAPEALISGLRIAGAPRPIRALGETNLDGLVLTPRDGRIEIDYLGISFAPGEVLRFQYRLGEESWGSPSEARSVDYAALAPGRYRFQVRASTAGGSVGRPAEISFRVLPPIWRRSWFVALGAVLVAGVLYQLHRHRVARLLAIEQIRTRIASDLHDDIGSSLTQIAIQARLLERRLPQVGPEEQQRLAHIGRVSSQLVDAMGEIVWAINPQRDGLSDLVHRMRRFALDALDPRGITLEFDAPEEATRLVLDPAVRRHLFLVFKESVHNAARHSGCTRVAVALRRAGRKIELSVSDDGAGFAPAEGGVEGTGLSSMRRRAAEIGGTLRIDTVAGGGTTVRLSVPLGRRSLLA
ncbi:MAG TPA: two-component regulator propeller domain-containing protein [Candidatus Polarisedimenticolaceae bacterium]|nr:two-component regulator propeller domain-containing protein [Candidatus Polarisedimenticolaceae bacterium]